VVDRVVVHKYLSKIIALRVRRENLGFRRAEVFLKKALGDVRKKNHGYAQAFAQGMVSL
jgi:hypothetical protein